MALGASNTEINRLKRNLRNAQEKEARLRRERNNAENKLTRARRTGGGNGIFGGGGNNTSSGGNRRTQYLNRDLRRFFTNRTGAFFVWLPGPGGKYRRSEKINFIDASFRNNGRRIASISGRGGRIARRGVSRETLGRRKYD